MKIFEIMRVNARPVAVHLEPWMLKTEPEIRAWLETNSDEKYGSKATGAKHFSIGPDLEISTHEDVNLDWKQSRKMNDDAWKKYINDYHDFVKNHAHEHTIGTLVRYGSELVLPVQFKSTGSFRFDTPATSLIGSPTHVSGHYDVTGAVLSDFHGFPEFIGRTASITNNSPLENFSTIPQHIVIGDREFVFRNNNYLINNCIGLPNIIETFRIAGVNSLKGVEKCQNLKIVSILTDDGLKGGILSILLCKNLDGFFWRQDEPTQEVTRLKEIISKHLVGDRDILECQEELRTAGLRQYGKL